jgi:hypothetical protein
MAESGWPASEITQEYLQNLVSQGYLTVAELATCRVPTDPASPASVRGYVVACSAFYERGFGAPSHRLLHLLLQFYGSELHHLTPSEVLHIARPTWGLSPTLICGTTSSSSGYERVWVRKRWCGVVWISPSNSDKEFSHTSASQCPTLQLDGRENGFF